MAETEKFKILFSNIRSINKNLEGLEQTLLLKKETYQYILLAEMWLDKNKTYPNLPGYKLFVTNREERAGGGVAIFASNTNTSYEIFELKYMTQDIESIFLKVDADVCVGCIYRPPSGNINNFLDKIEDIMEYITSIGCTLYIVGDFNLDISLKNLNTTKFMLLLLSYNFSNLITKPTRVTFTSSTMLDLLITNDQINKVESEVLQWDITDHFPVALTVSRTLDQIPEIQMFRDYSATSMKEFYNQCKNLDWENIYTLTDPDAAMYFMIYII